MPGILGTLPATTNIALAGEGGGAPTTSLYVVGATDSTLTNALLITGNTWIVGDTTVAAQMKFNIKDSAIGQTQLEALSVLTGKVAASAITYAKLQNVSGQTMFLGRITAGAGVVEEITGASATAFLVGFSTSRQGVAPATIAGTTQFLRADGTWAAPAASGSVDIKGTTITATYDSYDYSEVVTDAAVTSSSQILLGWGTTTVDDENTPDMESINFQAIPGTGQFTAVISSANDNSFGGVFKLNYLVG